MRVSIGQISKGQGIDLNGVVYTVTEWNHVKPGKGGAFVRTKLKNVKLGTVIDRTFRPDDKVEEAYIDKKSLQFLYSTRDTYEFMDHDTFEQVTLHREQLGDLVNYLKENLEVTALAYKDQILTIEPPIFIELKITSAEPGIRGDTSRAGTKPAETETGMSILVPLFIEVGDVIRIDTRTGEYVGRA